MFARPLVLAAVSVGLTACASQSDLVRLQQQVAAINVAIGVLGQPQTDETLRSEVKALVTTVGSLEAKVTDGATQIGRLDGRIGGVERTMRDAGTRVETLESTVAKLAVATMPAPAATSASLAPPASRAIPPAAAAMPTAEHAYALALATFRAREHGQAVLDFIDFLARYPRHPRGGNAQYWIGEAYFLQRDYRQATVEFEKVLEHGLAHPVVPDALFQVGLCHKRLRNSARATEVWRRLVRDYPKSEAATRARGLLRATAAN